MSQPPPSTRTRVKVAVAGFAASATALLLAPFASLDRALFDVATATLQEEVVSEVSIVEIDSRSLRELGVWPLPRERHAELIERLDRAGARTIFLDIDFSAASTPQGDERLAQAIDGARAEIILPAFWQPISSNEATLVLSEPLPSLQRRARLGLVNLEPASDGLVREVPDLSDLTPRALGPTWSLLPGVQHSATTDLPIDYRISTQSFPRVSYIDVLRGHSPPLLAGRIVFVGSTAIELSDTVPTPVHGALPGVVVQALAYESARRPLVRSAHPAIVLGALVAWAALLALLLGEGGRVRRWTALVMSLGALIVALGAYSFANMKIPVTPFAVAVLVALMYGLIAALASESARALRALVNVRDRDSLLKSIVESSTDALFTVDEHGVVLSANPVAGAMLGRSPQGLIGSALPEHASELAQAIAQAPPTGYDRPRELCLVHPSGRRIWIELDVSRIAQNAHRISVVTARDVTARHARESELRHLARHDILTGLPNRTLLMERAEEMLKVSSLEGVVGLLLLDLDGFKEINDALGHTTGDVVLTQLGLRLAPLRSANRLVARIGGDEFAILWRTSSIRRIEELTQQLLMLVAEPFSINGVNVSISTSIGVSYSPAHASDAVGLLKCADVALYAAKRKRTSVEIYDAHADFSSPRRLEVATHFRAALSQGELELHYQPKLALQTGAIAEVEALSRWRSAELGVVPPSEFVALAEASDAIGPFTKWTLKEAMSACRRWREAGLPLKMAVNLSARHLQDADLPHSLEALLVATRTAPEWLELEITESAIMVDPVRAQRILAAIHDLGVTLSIDDFGTGYSSLTYLRDLRVHRLKIDRSFVDGMFKSRKDEVIVEATIKLAHNLGLLAVAEGVETREQLDALTAAGCDIGQGYFIARPMPERELAGWIASSVFTTPRSQRSVHDEVAVASHL